MVAPRSGRQARSLAKAVRSCLSQPAAWYHSSMKFNTKSSITLPPDELKLVVSLQARLKAKSKVEVVRRGLRMLDETTNRERLREAYRRAALATRKSLPAEVKDLDALAGEGLEEW